MKNNTSNSEWTSWLLKALNDKKHDGKVLDNIDSILWWDNIDEDILQDGQGILKHIFAWKEQNIAQVISKSNDIDSWSAMDILKVAAPILMGYL